jgi:surface antigen
MRLILFLFLFVSTPAVALYEGLQCVPYARAVSGVEIRGDAHTWWGQAQGRYDRGDRPKVGAVLAFKPHGAMRLGHVAAVRKIVDSRTLLVSHANWSTIGGQRGHIEQDVRVVDASPGNDWSEVQVWYTPNAALGTTHWPVHGFIYANQQRSENEVRLAVADLTGGGDGNAASRPQVQVAAIGTPRVQGVRMLSFDIRLLADINRTAAKESGMEASEAPQMGADPIGDLIANVSG